MKVKWNVSMLRKKRLLSIIEKYLRMDRSVTFETTGEATFAPLTDEEQRLINAFFKPNYTSRVTQFAEYAPQFRRKRLFKMLDFASGNRPTSPPLTSPANDLAFNQNGGFGLTFSFSGKRSSRQTNPLRFSSPGINENGIFGYQSTTKQFSRTMPSKSLSQVHLAVTKMIRPEKAADVMLVADDFSGIWQELIKTIENPMSRSQANFGLSRSRDISTAASPRRKQFTQSLRLNDPTIAELYKSDSRWSPRLTIPRPM